METQLTFGKVLSHVIGWTVLGFMVLLLIGPVLAVVGTILPFALVGFVSWAGYRAIRRLVQNAKTGELQERMHVVKEKLVAQQAAARAVAREKFDDGVQLVKEKLAPDGNWQRTARCSFGRILRLPGAVVSWVVLTVLQIPLILLRLPLKAVAWTGRQVGIAVSAVASFVGRLASGALVQGRFAAVIMLEVFCGIAVGGLLGGLAEQRMSLHGDLVLTGAAIGGFLGVLVALSTPEPKRQTPSAG